MHSESAIDGAPRTPVVAIIPNMHLVGAFPGHDPTGDGDGDQDVVKSDGVMQWDIIGKSACSSGGEGEKEASTRSSHRGRCDAASFRTGCSRAPVNKAVADVGRGGWDRISETTVSYTRAINSKAP